MQDWLEKFSSLTALQAQLDAVLWAKVSAIATVISILVSAAALYGLLKSLKQTAEALQEAKDSRQDAKIASAAAIATANAANNIAEQAYHDDARPWLIVEDAEVKNISVTEDEEGITVKAIGSYKLKNIGKLPALRVHHICSVHLDPEDLFSELAAVRRKFNDDGTSIPPGTTIQRKFPILHTFPASVGDDMLRLNIVVAYYATNFPEIRVVFWTAAMMHKGEIVRTTTRLVGATPELEEQVYVRIS